MLFSSLLLTWLAYTAPTVHLVPPILTPETISEKISCDRPMRNGKFNISVSEEEGKTIVHCYGHGGAGWTTLFGSVQKAIERYEETFPNRILPIRVIGSGCMGLTVAIELIHRGYNVVGITTKSLYDMPSWRAAGYFALVSVKTSAEEQEELNQIGLNTFLAYQTIEQGLHPYLTADAVKYMPVYCSEKTGSGVEDLEAKGLIPPRRAVTLDFGNGVQHEHFNEFWTYFLNTSRLMHQLLAEAERLGIPIEHKTVQSFTDLEEPVLFNCTGLGGRELNLDQEMISVRGHLITLNQQAGTGHMDYMIYTDVEQEGKAERVYLFPKTSSITPDHTRGIDCFGILGGTFINGVDTLPDAEREALDQLEFQRLFDRNFQFFHGKKGS